jgi:hypothetical protein
MEGNVPTIASRLLMVAAEALVVAAAGFIFEQVLSDDAKTGKE